MNKISIPKDKKLFLTVIAAMAFAVVIAALASSKAGAVGVDIVAQNQSNAIYDTAADNTGNSLVGQTFTPNVTGPIDTVTVTLGEKSNQSCAGARLVRVEI